MADPPIHRSKPLTRWRCPDCSESPLHPSRRRGLEWLLLLVFVRPYRCHECCQRFWRSRLTHLFLRR
jgi:hypothetical protein